MKIHTMEFSPPVDGENHDIRLDFFYIGFMEVKSPEISTFGGEMEMVFLDFTDDRLKIWYFTLIYGSLGKILSVCP